MNEFALNNCFNIPDKLSSMHDFGEVFIDALPRHLKSLKIPGRSISDGHRRAPVPAQIDQVAELQNTMREILLHPITQDAHSCAEVRGG